MLTLTVADTSPWHSSNASSARLPRTMTVKTGGGGMHIYVKVPSSVRVRCTELAPGIELKGEGGSIIAPPSRHVSGEQYVWSVLRIDGPHLLPEAWLKQMPRQLWGPLQCDLPDRKRTRKSARKSRSRQLPSPHTPITICATSQPKQKAARSGDPVTKRAKPQTRPLHPRLLSVHFQRTIQSSAHSQTQASGSGQRSAAAWSRNLARPTSKSQPSSPVSEYPGVADLPAESLCLSSIGGGKVRLLT